MITLVYRMFPDWYSLIRRGGSDPGVVGIIKYNGGRLYTFTQLYLDGEGVTNRGGLQYKNDVSFHRDGR